MVEVFELNLPPLSDHLKNLVRQYVDHRQLPVENKQWLDDFHNNTVNCAEHSFANVPELDHALLTEYQKYFVVPICVSVGIMKNNWQQPTACQPPHVDRGRAMAINYYIESGGDNVRTVFYDYEQDPQPTAKNLLYSEVTPVASYVFPTDRWFAFDVNRAHSVENIETKRYYISIRMVENISTYTLAKMLAENSVTGRALDLDIDV